MAQYEILIKTELTDEDAKNLASDGKKTEAEKALAKTNASIQHALNYMITNTARNVVTNVVPELVRDSRVSDRINFAMNAVQTAQAFAINPIFGTAQLTMQVANDLIGYTLNAQKQFYRNQVNLQRAGYLNRSR